MRYLLPFAFLLCALPAMGQTVTNFDDTLTGWGSCGLSCAGGTGNATAHSQTINNASPSLDGAAMQLSVTGPVLSGGQTTNYLWYFNAGANNSATAFTSTWHVYVPSTALIQELEFDTKQFAGGHRWFWGSQCNPGGVWQIWDQLHGAWVTTSVACTLTAATWHTIVWQVHRVQGDISCASSQPCDYYDSLSVDGIDVTPGGGFTPQPSGPSGDADNTGTDTQIDLNSTGGTATEFLDQLHFAATSGPVCPSPYPSARCDLLTSVLPTLPPKVGPNNCTVGSLQNCGNLTGKGTVITDPNFGSAVSRLTDATLNPAHPNFTIITAGSGSGDENLINCNDTMLQVDDTGGRTYPMNFSGTSVTRMYATDPTYSANGGLFFNDGQFFWGHNCPMNANIWYDLGNGLLGLPAARGTKLGHFDFTNQAVVPSFILDFDYTSSAQCLGSGFTVTWNTNGGDDQTDTDFGFGFSNNGSQGGTGAIYVAVWRRGSGCRVLNLSTLTVTGDWGPTGAITGTTCNTGKIHNVKMFKGGGAGGAILVEAQPGQCADSNGMPYVWQYTGLNYFPICPSQCSGHWTEGLTAWVNNTGNAAPNFYDIRTITNTSPVGIVPALPTGGTQPQMDEHEGWNALNDSFPLFATTALFTGAPIAKAWANEVIAIDPLGISNPWRFANTYITGLSQRLSTQYAIGSISQTGKYFIFSSDWLNTLGSETGTATCVPTVNCRGDVFVVNLTPSVPPMPPSLSVIIKGGVTISGTVIK